MKYLWVPVFLFIVSSPALAQPAISCHCFQDRSYDPERGSASDPYFLATTQNSLLATAFGLSRKEVVRSKMSGASGDELWIVHYLASTTGKDPDFLRKARGAEGDWKSALTSIDIDPVVLGDRVMKVLEEGSGEEGLARAIVEQILLDRVGTKEGDLGKLRVRGADLKETILAVFISRNSVIQPSQAFDKVKSGGMTWGKLLSGLKIEPGGIEERWRNILRKGSASVGSAS